MEKIAIILAAGVGSRLRPETHEKPKALVNIAGKPILEYQLEALENIVNKIVIVSGYFSERIIEFIKKRENKVYIDIITNRTYENTNNMYSCFLALSKEITSGYEIFYIINGDVIIEPEIVNVMNSSDVKTGIAVDFSQYSEEAMKVIIKNSLITRISKDISPIEYSAVSIDFYKFSKQDIRLLYDAIKEYILEGQLNLWTEVGIQRAIAEKELKIKPIDITGLVWWEIDDKIDKKRAEYRIELLKNIQRLNTIKVYAFDLDGTIILGKSEINGASKLIKNLLSKGKKVYFITNNSSMSNREHAERLSKALKMNIPEEFIYSSLDYIGKKLSEDLKKRNVYALLPKNSREYLQRKFRINFVEENPDVVMVGFDTELTYEKLRRACIFIKNDAKYVLIHPDVRCPTEEGFVPDAGSIGKMIEIVINKTPDFVGGKPNEDMLKELANLESIKTEELCYIGDRVETDVEMAIKSGVLPVLFLTGDTDFEKLYKLNHISNKIILGENPLFLAFFFERHLF